LFVSHCLNICYIIQSIRYVKKDEYGRVRKALFEPDQNARIWNQIDEMLVRIAKEKWHDD